MKQGILVLGAAAVIAGIGGAAYLVMPEHANASQGRVLYDANCASCHGGNLEGQADWRSRDGDGRYPAPPHDATGHTWHHSDTDLIAYITDGGAVALAQMGVRFDSGMPAFGEVMTPEDIEDILAYLKSRWPERERAVQAERSLADSQ